MSWFDDDGILNKGAQRDEDEREEMEYSRQGGGKAWWIPLYSLQFCMVSQQKQVTSTVVCPSFLPEPQNTE